MEYEDMLHCIRAVSNLTGEDVVHVFGSQAPLMTYRGLPGCAAMSTEADIMAGDDPEAASYMIDGNLGEGTQFNKSFGLVVDGVIDAELSLPPEWEVRAHEFDYDVGDRIITVITPAPEDIAVAKLLAGREKDRLWLSAMLDAGMLDMQEMSRLIYTLPIGFEDDRALESRLDAVAEHRDKEWVR